MEFRTVECVNGNHKCQNIRWLCRAAGHLLCGQCRSHYMHVCVCCSMFECIYCGTLVHVYQNRQTRHIVSVIWFTGLCCSNALFQRRHCPRLMLGFYLLLHKLLEFWCTPTHVLISFQTGAAMVESVGSTSMILITLLREVTASTQEKLSTREVCSAEINSVWCEWYGIYAPFLFGCWPAN